jgi:hypothetical protein
LAQFDIVAETGHKRRLQAGAAEITGAEAREEEKQRAADNHGAKSHAECGEDEGAVKAALLLGVRVNFWRDSALGSTAHFEADECSHTEQEK